MSTIKYKCNICNREIQLIENKEGLTIFSKCVITEGCKGNLYKLERNSDNNRQIFPLIENGVVDYSPRKLLFKYTQTVQSSIWRIQHDLGVTPSVVVYEETANGTAIVHPDRYKIVILDKNTISVSFDVKLKGTVHCIARTTVINRSTVKLDTKTMVKVTYNGNLTIAIPEEVIRPFPVVNLNTRTIDNIQMQVSIKPPNLESITSYEIFNTGINKDTSWVGWDRILINKRKKFTVRTKNILDFIMLGGLNKKEDITNGTTFKFTQIVIPNLQDVNIPPNFLLFLLSDPPYQSVDKVTDKLIDVGSLIKQDIDYFVYIDGDLYIDATKVAKIIPNISRVR